ncbi:hypothetical protein [Brevibacillus migulae]|uniref:hypothetical protein n=1 Tax=Brevibacillus migulae TaxID=1644114 RepID=UPI00106E074A|nr:hypothetical protein [Brevibacillus migulae]
MYFKEAYEKKLKGLDILSLVALYKGFQLMKKESINEGTQTQFKNPLIGLLGMSTLQVSIKEAMEIIAEIIGEKSKDILDELQKNEE